MVTAMDVQGKVIRQGKVTNDEVSEFFRGSGEVVEVALQATRNSSWLYDLLEESGLCGPEGVEEYRSEHQVRLPCALSQHLYLANHLLSPRPLPPLKENGHHNF